MSTTQRQARLLAAASIWGPPAGPDAYRARNMQWARNKIRQMKINRKQCLKDGNTRMAEALTLSIDGLRGTLQALER